MFLSPSPPHHNHLFWSSLLVSQHHHGISTALQPFSYLTPLESDGEESSGEWSQMERRAPENGVWGYNSRVSELARNIDFRRGSIITLFNYYITVPVIIIIVVTTAKITIATTITIPVKMLYKLALYIHICLYVWCMFVCMCYLFVCCWTVVSVCFFCLVLSVPITFLSSCPPRAFSVFECSVCL